MKLQPFQFFSPRKPRRSFHLESDDKPAGENRLKSANSGVYRPAAALSDWCSPGRGDSAASYLILTSVTVKRSPSAEIETVPFLLPSAVFTVT